MKKVLILTCFLISAINGKAQNFTALDSLRGGWHAGRSCFDLLHYHLKVKVFPESRSIKGSNRWTCRGLQASAKVQVDLHPDLVITEIISSGGAARWTRTGSSVQVDLPFRIEAEKNFWLEIRYQGQPPAALNPPWEGGFVWSADERGKPWIGVACEGDGASIWYPAKDHPTDEADSVLLEYEVPQSIMAVGNGRFLGMEKSGDSTAIYRYRVSYPINHYNLTLNAGDFRVWSDSLRLPEGGKILQMSFYALPENQEKARRHWGREAKKALLGLSELFGDYPFCRDGYRLVQTPYLGMEHQSCISYGDQFHNNAYDFDFIVAHETAHEWWGNQLSSDDHADFWLHEAFATYAEALLVEKWQGKEKSLQYLMEQKKKIKNRSPMAGPRGVYFNDWKDSDVYYKGTWMLHSMRYALNNDSLWFSFLKTIGKENGFRPVSAETFTTLLTKKLRMDFAPFVQYFTQSLNWPCLEYFLNQTKSQFEFHWVWPPEGFPYAAPVRADGKLLRLNADHSEVIYKPENAAAGSRILPEETLFLYRLQERKRK